MARATVRPARTAHRRRAACLHLSFIGGFSLLIFAVSFHVAFLHTGREAQAKQRSPSVWLVGALTLLATEVRLFAERFPSRYFEALTLASSLWVASAVIWRLQLVWMIVVSPRSNAADAGVARP